MHLSTLVETAANLRRRARQLQPPFSTRKIIAASFPKVAVTGRTLPPRIDELATRTRDGGLIVYRRDLPIPDQRVAIAHGLAHLIFDDDKDACAVGSVGTPACELRADAFAAELLAPLEILLREMKRWRDRSQSREIYLDRVDQLASLFHVPADVIDVRIRVVRRLMK